MKKIIESIYGMQYEELIHNGGDGNKARFNGNLFLAAYVIVILFLVIVACTHISDYNETMNRFVSRTFGVFNSTFMGKVLSIPLFGGIYFIISRTTGSEKSFQKHVEAYVAYSDAEKRKSFKRVLLPFIIMLVLMLLLSF